MTEKYFPMGNKRLRRFENSVRKKCRDLEPKGTQAVYRVMTTILPWFVQTKFSETSTSVEVTQQGKTISFPKPMPLIKYSHVSYGYTEILKRKYCLPGFLEVEQGDVVVDCGAFVGGFSLSAIDLAKAIHLFEPSAANAECIARNLGDRDGVFINECGLYDKDMDMTINYSSSAVEHSLLEPDDGDAISTGTILVKRLDSYFNELSVVPDFVKIEAEGVEIEVFDGLGKLRPKKIAIDASPERDGESPIVELEARLNKIGYETKRRHFMLFARHIST